MIANDLQNQTDMIKEIILQMIVKAINDTTESDELVFTLLMFDAYSRMHIMNLSTSTINQWVTIIEKEMT